MVSVTARGEPIASNKERPMNYQPISDPAQLQILDGLTRIFLHGVLIAIAGASVLLLCLCLSELRLLRCPPPVVERSEWTRGRGLLLAARRGASLDRLTPIR